MYVKVVGYFPADKSCWGCRSSFALFSLWGVLGKSDDLNWHLSLQHILFGLLYFMCKVILVVMFELRFNVKTKHIIEKRRETCDGFYCPEEDFIIFLILFYSYIFQKCPKEWKETSAKRSARRTVVLGLRFRFKVRC